MNSLFGINAIKVVNLKLRDTVTFKLMVLVLAHFVHIHLRFDLKMEYGCNHGGQSFKIKN